MLTIREAQAAFLKSHGYQETRLRGTIARFLERQADHLAAEISKRKQNEIGPWLVPHIFNLQAEHERLMAAIERPILWSMGQAAAETLAAAKRDRRKAKQFDFGNLPAFEFNLPANVLAAIRQAFRDLSQQSYWKNIQSVTSVLLTDILESGIQQGASDARIARAIREQMGGNTARKRTMVIARTETTGSLNAGNQAAGEDLQREGFSVIKRWSTTRDSDGRPDHMALDGTSVANSANFSVGGYSAPYPGHYSLPAAQRVNCRCGCITRVSE